MVCRGSDTISEDTSACKLHHPSLSDEGKWDTFLTHEFGGFQTAVKYKLCLTWALHHRPRIQGRVSGMQPTLPPFPHYLKADSILGISVQAQGVTQPHFTPDSEYTSLGLDWWGSGSPRTLGRRQKLRRPQWTQVSSQLHASGLHPGVGRSFPSQTASHEPALHEHPELRGIRTALCSHQAPSLPEVCN